MKGFTLIEVVIYIALLGVLMTGALESAVTLIQTSGSSNGKATVQEEGSFVQRKLLWAMSGVQTINVPSSGTASNLRVTKYDGTQVDFCLLGGSVRMHEGPANALPCSDTSFNPITTSNVSANNISFKFVQSSPGPAGIIATVTINNLDFAVTKYVRQ